MSADGGARERPREIRAMKETAGQYEAHATGCDRDTCAVVDSLDALRELDRGEAEMDRLRRARVHPARAEGATRRILGGRATGSKIIREHPRNTPDFDSLW